MLTQPQNENARLEELRAKVADKLLEIEALCEDGGFPTSRTTLIARDLNRPSVVLVFTNETPQGVREACAHAINTTPRAIIVAGEEA